MTAVIPVSPDGYVIVQRQDDGHHHVIANGRIFSHRRDALAVYDVMTHKFDALVAAGNAGTWRPILKAVKWLDAAERS